MRLTARCNTLDPMGAVFDIPIPGVTIGHAEDPIVKTGSTVCLFNQPVTAAVHIMGAAPGTRDTELLSAENTVDEVDALVLSGGSAYGLDAAGGVQAWLREHGRGINLDPVRIPIVPTAILFDLRNDGDKDWGRYSPYRELGYTAISNHTPSPRLGAVGAAHGATTANAPGGFGLAAATVAGRTVLAGAAVNAIGSPLVGDTKHFWAAPFEQDEEFGGRGTPHPWPEDATIPRTKGGQRVAGTNTTLGFVVTDMPLNAAQAKRIAVTAHDGFARALYPVHTSADGDLIFVASTTGPAEEPCDTETLLDLGIVAGNTICRAIARGVYEALMDEKDDENGVEEL